MKFWNFIQPQNESEPAELLIYGDIGEWGKEWGQVSSKEFAADLKAVKSKTLNIRINSGGGGVFTGQAIYSMLKRFDGVVNTYVDGLAASIASVIALAGKTHMPRNASFMIHNPWSYVVGTSKDFRKAADDMDKIGESIINVYVDKTGLDRQTIVDMMDAETWMDADEAKELGFVDVVEEPISIAASVKDDKIIFNNVEMTKKFNIPEKHLKNYNASGQDSSTETPNLKENSPLNNQGLPPSKENQTMTIEELKAKHPELYAQIIEEGKKEGVKAEQSRIKDLEDSALPGHEALLAKAKFETPMDSAEFAKAVLKAEKESRTKYAQNRQEDADDLTDVGGGATEDSTNNSSEKAKDDATRQKMRDASKKVVASMKNRGSFSRKDG